MSPMPFLLLLCLFYLRARAHETTVWDCAEPLNVGIIQFPDADCKPKTNVTSADSVRYAIYSDERAACGMNEMTLTDDKYEPQTVGYWMRTIEKEILNCALEQVQLHQQMEDEGFSTPIGKASTAAGTLAHNHLTLVKDTTRDKEMAHST
ncbi:hypothetical protein OUZ56_018558 [Daphnia magna]|uniref:Uncharacterized protein n=1 Tax=Daphnia magna TaxID=35525 RepID=A0ABQ9ZAB6_9CRUS|nr:hypothetical protein OUZ56_018558 [Daphnia magna]